MECPGARDFSRRYSTQDEIARRKLSIEEFSAAHSARMDIRKQNEVERSNKAKRSNSEKKDKCNKIRFILPAVHKLCV